MLLGLNRHTAGTRVLLASFVTLCMFKVSCLATESDQQAAGTPTQNYQEMVKDHWDALKKQSMYQQSEKDWAAEEHWPDSMSGRIRPEFEDDDGDFEEFAGAVRDRSKAKNFRKKIKKAKAKAKAERKAVRDLLGKKEETARE